TLPQLTAGLGRSVRRFAVAVAFLGAFAGAVPAAQAAVLPPTVTFTAPNPPTMQVGGATLHLQVTLTNPDPSTTENNISTTITLPSGLSISRGSLGCNGPPVTWAPGGTTASITGLTLAAGSFCSFAINIQASSTGTKVVTSDAISSTESGPGTPA